MTERRGRTAADPSPAEVPNLVRGLASARCVPLAHVMSPATPTLDDRPTVATERRVEIRTKVFEGKGPMVKVFSDTIAFPTHTGTHIDALGHWCVSDRHHAGVPASLRPGGSGVASLGVEQIPVIRARGVLIDIAAVPKFSDLGPGDGIDAQTIVDCLGASDVALLPGDCALIRTGWSRHWLDPQRYMSGAPGLTPDAAEYLCDAGCAVIGTDQWSVDVIPAQRVEEELACHAICLVDRGVYLIENLNLEELSATGRHEFALVALVAPVLGATAFPLQAIALF